MADPAVQAGESRIRVVAGSVNAGDWHLLRGRPYLLRVSQGLRRPRIGRLGVDIAGVVEAGGTSDGRFAVGDAVYGMVPSGALAECVAGGDWIVHKPPSLTMEEAAAVPAAGCTALQALRDRGRVQPGERVLIHGAAGGVGTFAVQLAKAFGATVTASTATSKVEFVRSLGADEVVDHDRAGMTHPGRGYDLIIDIGAERSIGALRRMLAPGGRVVVVGAGRGTFGPIGRFASAAIRSRVLRQRVTGFLAGPPFRDDLETLTAMIEAGTVRPMIDSTFPLARAGDAFARFGSGQVRGKVVITIPPDGG